MRRHALLLLVIVSIALVAGEAPGEAAPKPADGLTTASAPKPVPGAQQQKQPAPTTQQPKKPVPPAATPNVPKQGHKQQQGTQPPLQQKQQKQQPVHTKETDFFLFPNPSYNQTNYPDHDDDDVVVIGDGNKDSDDDVVVIGDGDKNSKRDGPYEHDHAEGSEREEDYERPRYDGRDHHREADGRRYEPPEEHYGREPRRAPDYTRYEPQHRGGFDDLGFDFDKHRAERPGPPHRGPEGVNWHQGMEGPHGPGPYAGPYPYPDGRYPYPDSPYTDDRYPRRASAEEELARELMKTNIWKRIQEVAEEERILALARKREMLLTPEEKLAIEDMYRKKYGGKKGGDHEVEEEEEEEKKEGGDKKGKGGEDDYDRDFKKKGKHVDDREGDHDGDDDDDDGIHYPSNRKSKEDSDHIHYPSNKRSDGETHYPGERKEEHQEEHRDERRRSSSSGGGHHEVDDKYKRYDGGHRDSHGYNKGNSAADGYYKKDGPHSEYEELSRGPLSGHGFYSRSRYEKLHHGPEYKAKHGGSVDPHHDSDEDKHYSGREDAKYPGGEEGPDGDDDDDEKFWEGDPDDLYSGGHGRGYSVSIKEVEHFYEEHIGEAACLQHKSGSYKVTGGTAIKPTDVTMDLTCCKKYDKRDHLKKVGMPVRNGMDQLTVASCVWHFDYFNAVLGGSSKHMPAGYANVSCNFNAAAHYCGDVPNGMQLSGTGMLFAVPAKTPVPGNNSSHPHLRHRAKVVRGGSASTQESTEEYTEAELLSAGSIPTSDDKDKSKYYHQTAAAQHLGPVLEGTSLVAKIPLGKESSYGIKMAGLVEGIINFYNAEVTLPPPAPITKNLTSTTTDNKRLKLVHPGRVWLMLEEAKDY